MGDSDRPFDETHTKGGGTGDRSASPRTKRLGDFEVLRELGRGGMGVVFEARQVSLRRRVALKVLPPALGMGKNAVERFEREAHAAAKLHHTNIVPVYATGEEGGSHYYAMELIEGEPLDKVLRDLVEEHSNPLMEATVARESSRARSASDGTPIDTTSTSHSDTTAARGSRRWPSSSAKSPTPSTTRTAAESSTATSSPPTSCSPRTGD